LILDGGRRSFHSPKTEAGSPSKVKHKGILGEKPIRVKEQRFGDYELTTVGSFPAAGTQERPKQTSPSQWGKATKISNVEVFHRKGGGPTGGGVLGRKKRKVRGLGEEGDQ